MSWLEALEKTNAIAHAILVLCVVSISGFAIATIKIRGIGLGSAGVLFAGLLFGHFGWKIEHSVLDFAREFGLILFVFTIGLQIGPGFFASLQREGLVLNLCAAAIVLGGAGLAALTVPVLGAKSFAAAGLFSGATTNTPSLGAGQEAISAVPNSTAEDKAMPALAYAVAYPGGVFGIIACVVLLGKLFRVKQDAELEAFENERRSQIVPVHRRSLEVTKANLDGLRIAQIPGVHDQGIAVSRLKSAGGDEIRLATDDATVHVGDILLAVGTEEALEGFQRIIGRTSEIDLMRSPGPVEFRHLLVTREQVLGKSLRQLALGTLCGVVVTRIQRGGVEITARADFRVEFGDSLHVVGDARDRSWCDCGTGSHCHAGTACAGSTWTCRRSSGRGNWVKLAWPHWEGGLVYAVRGQSCPERAWHRAFSRLRWIEGGLTIYGHTAQSGWSGLARCRVVHHPYSVDCCRNRRASPAKDEFRRSQWADSREHDRSTGACVCQHLCQK